MNTKLNETNKIKYLGPFELLILSSICELDEAYGVAIKKHLLRKIGRDFNIGSIYTALDRLRQRNMVVFLLAEKQKISVGRRRKIYTLTPLGKSLFEETKLMLETMWADINQDTGEKDERPPSNP